MLHAASGYALTGLFAALALMAVYACRGDADLRLVGAMLLIDCLASNLVVYATHDAQARAGAYTFAEIIVAVAAYLAFAMDPRRHTLIVVVMLSVVSMCATVAYALMPAPSKWQVNIWHLITNGCFAANCLLIAATGRLDAVGAARFWPWSNRGGGAAQPHGIDG